jgi:Flp pilus assembly pilin Flp
MITLIRSVIADDRGQDFVEYAMLLGLIAGGAYAAVKGLGTTINTDLNGIGADI